MNTKIRTLVFLLLISLAVSSCQQGMIMLPSVPGPIVPDPITADDASVALSGLVFDTASLLREAEAGDERGTIWCEKEVVDISTASARISRLLTSRAMTEKTVRVTVHFRNYEVPDTRVILTGSISFLFTPLAEGIGCLVESTDEGVKANSAEHEENIAVAVFTEELAPVTGIEFVEAEDGTIRHGSS